MLTSYLPPLADHHHPSVEWAVGGSLSTVNAPGYSAAMGGAVMRLESWCHADGRVLSGMGQPQQGKGEGGHQWGLAQGSTEWAVGGGWSTVNVLGYRAAIS